MTLNPKILNGLEDVNFTELTELQKAVLPIILDAKDALIKANTGSDKFASFVIPALETASKNGEKEGTSVLILTPNANSLKKIEELLSGIGYHTEIPTASIGDEQQANHEEILEGGITIIAASPDPLHQAMQEKRFVFRYLDLLIIDAADEMIAGSSSSKIGDITKRILSDHQTVIYSGEFTDEVQKLSDRYLNEPAILGMDEQSRPQVLNKPPKVADNLSHGYIYVPSRMKITTLMAHIEDASDDRCVIFTASKRGTDRLYRILRKHKYKATSLHGKLSAEKRAQRFANFTNGDIQFLLVADISASQLDLREVKQVINYDVPNDADEYRFRADLVGTGKTTQLVSLVSKQDRSDINQLENELGKAPKELSLPKKVEQKLKQRKKQNKHSSKRRNKSKKRRNGHSKKRQKKEMELPRPSFDKLSGGRSGNKKEDSKSTVIGMLKKIFS